MVLLLLLLLPQVTPVFSLRPTTGNTSAVNATSLTRVTVTGCNMVPEASASVTGYQAVRAFTWAAKAAVTPGSIAELQFTQQAGVDYMINFTRSSKVAEQTAVGKLVFRNPYSKPIRMAGVTYKVVSPGDGAVLASGDVSCPATGANKTVTVPAAALKGNQTVKGSLTCNLKVVVPGGAKGNLMIGFTTSASESKRTKRPMGTAVCQRSCFDVHHNALLVCGQHALYTMAPSAASGLLLTTSSRSSMSICDASMLTAAMPLLLQMPLAACQLSPWCGQTSLQRRPASALMCMATSIRPSQPAWCCLSRWTASCHQRRGRSSSCVPLRAMLSRHALDPSQPMAAACNRCGTAGSPRVSLAS